ncbi:MAG TPA: DUF4397 domain-containing protein [Longimicrobiales bacterium]|nr:DUF4397 domain-containing protein [Longimicrobiales bacterium]
MKYSLKAALPVFALMLGIAACDDDTDLTGTLLQTRVRFVNAIPDVTSTLGLAVNNTVAAPAINFGATGQCALVSAGNAALAYGAVNSTGTALQGTPLETIGTQLLAANSSYTVVATGTQANPQFVLVNDVPAGTPPTGMVRLRFVNAGLTDAFDVYARDPDDTTLGTPLDTSVEFSTSTAFIDVPVGSSELVFTMAGTTDEVFTTSFGALNQGDIRTILLIPDTQDDADSDVNLVILPRCS